MVLSMDFYVKREFTEGIYDSCKDVYLPSADTKAVETMCGSLGPNCNAERWFKFMGTNTQDGGLAPFSIIYKYLDNSTEIHGRNITPITDVTYPCETSVSFHDEIDMMCFISYSETLKNHISVYISIKNYSTPKEILM